jgi:hypothetical protein
MGITSAIGIELLLPLFSVLVGGDVKKGWKGGVEECLVGWEWIGQI